MFFLVSFSCAFNHIAWKNNNQSKEKDLVVSERLCFILVCSIYLYQADIVGAECWKEGAGGADAALTVHHTDSMKPNPWVL